MNTSSSTFRSLKAYENFFKALTNLASRVQDISEFSQIVKTDPQMKHLRTEARREFEQIYTLLSRHFDLPYLPIYVPLRKKVRTRGFAFASPHGAPTEIRIYPIEAPDKPYEEWTPSDLSCSSKIDIFDTFIHEVAHVLEAKRNARMSHGQSFKKARREIQEFLIDCGFGNLIKSVGKKGDKLLF